MSESSPRRGRGLALRVFYRICWSLLIPAAWFRWRLQARGREKLPRDGPFLLLANHCSFFDPVFVAWPLWRPVNFMASSHLFRIPVLGTICAALGAFPKVKYVKDRDSMRTLVARYQRGEVVVLFPEGERTWDGRQLTVLPGIGRLVRRMNARVVYCRILTGHLHRPRWATTTRSLPVIVEYDGPYTYPPEMTAEEITAEVSLRLRIDPHPPVPRATFGRRLAEGLPQYLWACPACKVTEGLSVAGAARDEVRCADCGARWRVGLGGRLHPAAGEAPALDVVAAYDRISAHFGELPVADARRRDETGAVLECARLRVGQVARGQREPSPVADGPARLTPERLEILGEDGVAWSIELVSLKAVVMELGGVLHLRTEDTIFQLDPEGQSTLKWRHFIEPWWAKARARAVG